MYDILTIGGATRDVFLVSSKYKQESGNLLLPWGEKVIAEEMIMEIGGGACNSAVGFSRLGFKTAFWGIVGGDQNGEEVAKRLKAEKVSLEFLTVSNESTTSYSVVLADRKGGHSICMYRGENDDLLETPFNLKSLSRAKLLYLTDIASSTEGLSYKISNIAKEKKIKLVFVPGQNQLDLGFDKLIPVIGSSDIFILNIYEACKLAKINYSRDKKTNRSLLTAFCDAGAKIAVITEDKDGVDAYDGSKFIHNSAFPAENMVDTTGAGDAFSVGFTASILKGRTLQESLEFGCRNSASVISRWGAQKGLLASFTS